MAALTLRNIPDDLYHDLKQQAAQHHRSLNKEVVHLLEHAVRQGNSDNQNWLLQAEEMRKQLGGMPLLDDEMLKQAKDDGRL